MNAEQKKRLEEIDVVLSSPEEQTGPWWDMTRYLRTLIDEQAAEVERLREENERLLLLAKSFMEGKDE